MQGGCQPEERRERVWKAKVGPRQHYQGAPNKVTGECSCDMGVDGLLLPHFPHSFYLVLHVHLVLPPVVSFTDALLYYLTRRWLIIIFLLVLQAGGSDKKASQGHEEKH